jgi:hypothetical protein
VDSEVYTRAGLLPYSYVRNVFCESREEAPLGDVHQADEKTSPEERVQRSQKRKGIGMGLKMKITCTLSTPGKVIIIES